MAMMINKVTEENKKQLIDYAAKYGIEHDSSYLPGRDFDFSDETPSYLLMEKDKVVGAVCLMRTKRFLSVNKGRFSIFHSETGKRKNYAQLLDALRPEVADLQSVFMFIPETKVKTAEILTALGFNIERYSFVLERSEPAISAPVFPDGYSVKPLEQSDLEGIGQFAACLNEEFKDLAGHTRSTPEDVRTWFDDKSYIAGGLCLLKKGQEAVGTISMMRDLDDLDAGEIGAFGILKEYRGSELGRNLLRYGINFLHEQEFSPVVLSVNGENHGAIKLYRAEGFNLIESVICYALES